MRHLIFKVFCCLCGLILSVFTSGCTLHRLDVQTQYLSHEYLASYHVDTPDPRRYNPIIGQRLLVQWSLCAEEMSGQELFLYLKVRFRNHQEQEVTVPIRTKRGTYLYELVNEAYCQSGGILTYHAEIRNDSCILASWKHPLWRNLIIFDFSETAAID
jgi:hypothetical protein